MRSTLAVALVAVLLLALTPALTSAGTALPLGRYTGQTGDGHVFQFTVVRNKNPAYPRRITHFYLVYDIAGCRSGPIRQPSFASVYYGNTANRRGTFARDLGHHSQGPGTTGEVQLSLTGRFTSATKASGSFRVGVFGKCPLDASSPVLTFKVKRKA